eukprot:TRINITY_DN10460_c0_g3_i1.p1 TRINITY_DN10460_c0_g3~~TRINITY_DN10460_c0_g3_i1.p1  ORF type:complete len:401 (+),score=51.88 TRINITY_DN10460_c0_g3_i1:1450-2652(+)
MTFHSFLFLAAVSLYADHSQAYDYTDSTFVNVQLPSYLAISHTGVQALGSQDRRFGSAFDDTATIAIFRGQDTSILTACFNACADSDKCKGVFSYSPAPFDFRCRVLNRLDGDLGTATRSLSLGVRPAAVTPGCTGFDDNGAPCHVECEQVGTCFFGFCGSLEQYRAPAASTCILSQSNGSVAFGQCQSTSFCSAPAAVDETPFWDQPRFSLAATGGMYASNGVPRARFRSAFSHDARIQTINDATHPFTKCFDACLSQGACTGLFIWDHPAPQLDHVCYLFGATADHELIPTASNSLSFVRSRSSLASFIADGVNSIDLPYYSTNGLRFEHAFDSAHRLLELQQVSQEDCAKGCNDRTACRGFFFWQQSLSLVRCFLLDDVGELLPTSSSSVSYRKLWV